MDGRYAQQVPCGHCSLCNKRKSATWAFRLGEELKRSTSGAFITLTYAKTPVTQNGHPTLCRKEFPKFIKRLRHKEPTIPYTKKDGTTGRKSPIKYYACGEYGSELGRPHYHAIVFNLSPQALNNSDIIHSAWGLGHVTIDPCNGATMRYVTNYVMKGKFQPEDCQETGLIDDRIPEFNLMSKNMGLNYLTPQMVKYHVENQITHITKSGGALAPLPRYFRDKIFSKEEKIQLNKEAEAIRDLNFEKLFNNSFKKEQTWKIDQIRKEEKQQRLTRQKL